MRARRGGRVRENPCPITVGTIVGLIASARSIKEILEAYPYLERDDIHEALSYAAWRAEEVEIPLAS
jgi:uncharacterized protein (DUF433 family)